MTASRLHYVGTEVHRVVADTAGRAAYRVSASDGGGVEEQRLEADVLG